MSDEQERADTPAAGETPSQPPADTPPAPSEPAAAEAPGAQPAAAAAEEPKPAAEEKAPEAPVPAPEPAPAAPEPAPAPAANYDGLESGLSWFGFERFEPPVPVGYEPLPGAAPTPARELSAEELDERRRRIHGRFASRRQEVETQKTWYQKIPMGALSMVPVLIVLLVVAILYPPWQSRVFPGSKEPLDEALLSAQPLPNPDEVLRGMGVQEAQPQCWRVLPGGVVTMTGMQTAAKLTFGVPKNASRLEVGCDVCLLEREPTNWGVSITLDGSVGLTLRDHPKNPGKDYVAGRLPGNTLVGYQHEIKPRTWNEIKLVVDAAGTRYYFNGTELKATVPRPASLAKVELNTYNTRLLLRNWRIKPLE